MKRNTELDRVCTRDCPKCGGITRVLDTRGKNRNRICPECNHRFATVEIPVEAINGLHRLHQTLMTAYSSLLDAIDTDDFNTIWEESIEQWTNDPWNKYEKLRKSG